MSNTEGYFFTDWAAMTANDWIGMGLTVIVFFAMIWAYIYAFHPKNRDDFEKRRYLPFSEEDESLNGEKNERKK